MTDEERKVYKKQLKIIELSFKNDIIKTSRNIKLLSIKYPGRIFSVNDIQNLR